MEYLNDKLNYDNEFSISSTSNGGCCGKDGERTSHLTRKTICCFPFFIHANLQSVAYLQANFNKAF